MIWLSILGALIVLLMLLRRSKRADVARTAPAPKKIPAVILEYEKLQKEKEERRKSKIEELLSRPLPFDPTNNESLKHLVPVQTESQCLFAKKAKAWGNEWNPNLSLEENVERALPAITNFFLVGESLHLDAFSIEVQGKDYSSTIEQLGETVRRVLTVISDRDPAGDHVMNDPRIHLRGWRYKFNSEDIFITVLAPCYPHNHARYTFNAGGDLHSAFILLQPEWSFGYHNIGPDHVWDDEATTVRQKIRQNFVKHGRKYYVPPARFYPMAPQVIPSLKYDGEFIEWWHKPDESNTEDKHAKQL
jgi:hypothetical protein